MPAEVRPFVALWESGNATSRALALLTPQQAITPPLAEMRLPVAGASVADSPLKPLRQALPKTPDRAGLLVLDAALPALWQDAPWEGLTLSGRTLAESLLVVRHATPHFGVQALSGRRTAWLNLFPSDGAGGFDFIAALQPQIDAEQLIRVLPRSLTRGLDGYDDLFILAHGDSQGLLDATGRSFSLGTEAFPPRVWLLACNLDGAMYRLAESLLARGVRSVVTATGEISAPEMAGLLAAWCGREVGVALEDWLLAQRQATRRVNGGLHALTLFGQCSLDDSNAAAWNGKIWNKHRHQLAPLRLVDADEACFRAALAMVEAPEGWSRLWPLTLGWLMGEALAAAENFDHQVMHRLLRKVENAPGVPRIGPAWCYAQANAVYRLGHHDLAASHIAAGLDGGSLPSVERAELLGLLTNVLIDMNLPGAAQRVAQLHADCSAQIDDFGLRDGQDFRRLDWEARIAMRERRFDDAIHVFASKRQQSNEPEDTRELAWLLYASAWQHRHAGAPVPGSYRDEVVQILALRDASHIGKGNDGTAYLLRALACWRWGTDDASCDPELVRWVPLVRQGMTASDPGPWAFAGAYLALTDCSRFAALGKTALDALARARYWLDAAGFAELGLEGCGAEAAPERFRAMRTKVLVSLHTCLPALADPGDDTAPIIPL